MINRSESQLIARDQINQVLKASAKNRQRKPARARALQRKQNPTGTPISR